MYYFSVMRFLLCSVLVSLLLPVLLPAQVPVVPQFRALLPDTLSESSGLEYVSDTSLWSHNDSGDPGRLCQINTNGTLLRVLNLRGVVPVDNEELAQDSLGNFYIGDFGNNSNDRTNLRIYKIPPPESIVGDSVTPQVIAFNFADQTAFPPPTAEQNFDCEAMFHYRNHLYVISKNRGTSTYARMYKLPDTAGVYSVLPIDSFNTQPWVTSADISPDGRTMVLFSEWNIHVFTNFSGDQFFQGTQLHLTMSPYTQKEAVVFANDSVVFITDEVLLGFGGKLYSLNLRSALNGIPETNATGAQLFPNPAIDEVQLTLPVAGFRWSLVAADGREVQQGYCTGTTVVINSSLVVAGLYQMRIITQNGQTGVLPLLRTR